jgi:hypothetical protein
MSRRVSIDFVDTDSPEVIVRLRVGLTVKHFSVKRDDQFIQQVMGLAERVVNGDGNSE